MNTKRFLLMLLVMLVSVTGAYAQMSFIKDVKVRVGEKNQYSDLTSEGYTVISGPDETYFDFNGGGTGGDYVYIGYKTTTNPNEAISDLAIVYNNSGTSTAYGSDAFLYGGSKTMMIGSKRYYLAPHSGGPDMNNRNDKHNNCVYLYYTRDVDASDGMRLLTTLGGNRWGSRHTTVPTGWDSMIRGYMGNGQPTTTGGSNYVVTYDTERVFGDTNEAGGGDYTYILCNYVSGIYYVDIDGQKKFPNSITEITNTSSTLSAGGYIVRGTDVQTGTLTCNGAVNIILADGAKLTATGQANNAGIQVSAAGSSLAIYGQTAQTGQLTAIGGTGASAIDGGSPGAASPIYVNTSLTVCADGNNPPTTFVDYTIGVDVSASLSGKRYATMRIPQNITVTLDRQGGTGGSEQVNVMEGSAMPTISVPTRTGYTFHGYYASQNGTGTKYYNADGTSAHKWDRTSTATLYAHWTANQYTVTFDMQNGIGGTESATATYDAAMPEITIPTREDYAFLGYFSQPNGRGTKYYNADGTSAQAWNVANNTTTLYAQWKLVRLHYIDADGSKKFITEFTEITNASSTTTLSSGWYIVYDADVQTHTLVCEGAVNLVLMDGAKLTATGDYFDAGIRVSAEGASLTIYGQQNQNGQLIATGDCYGAGIGGANNGSGHDIIINGGVITANGGYWGAGIGGGNWGSGHDITINGGVITAGGTDASAIGAGNRGSSSNIFINSSLILWADGSNPPTTRITHLPDEDVSNSLNGRTYAIVRNPTNGVTITFDKQSGTGGTNQITVDEGSVMPDISVPERDGYAFVGYFSGPDGTGTKYYKCDGTSDQLWNQGENVTLYAYWTSPVPYIDADGTTKYAGIDKEITNETTTLRSGWYLVNDADVQTHTLVCEGAVHLILADGAKLKATGGNFDAGIRVSAEGASLTIYGQQNQTGQLIATGGYFGSGIGGAREGSGHDITINGGVITANGGSSGAGIGGGNLGTGHDITINGGVITAEGGTRASAIGAGDRGSSSNIFVNSSQVLYADGNNPPTTIINHTTGVDVSSKLSGKQYAIVRTPAQGITVTFDKQDGTGGDDQTTANETEEMPQIQVPTRNGYAFQGYYAGQNGTGVKYYNADGTSANPWNHTESATLYAYWKVPVSYIDADGTEKEVGVFSEITNSTTTTTLAEGWYIVRGADVQTHTLVCEGAVNIILADGAKLTATATDQYEDPGIRVSAEGASLTIYGQQNQTGQLIANGGDGAAGIGGGDQENGHNITINGGVITTTGGDDGSGIGGGSEGSGHNITINGGVITTTGGMFAAGIGGGGFGAFSSNITINGGVVTANGGEKALTAIGSGFIGSASNNITINASLILKADGNATPTTEIEHTSTVDLASTLNDKRYATLALPTVNVNKVPEQDVNYGTFYHKYADYTVPNEDATIYTASIEDVQGETCLVLHKLEGNVIPANTAVILRTDESSVIDLKPCADASGISVPANSLSGANLPMDAPANCYILNYGQNPLGFYRYEQGNTLAAHEAFLIIQHGAPEFLVMQITVQPSGDITGTKMVVTKKNGKVTRFDANNIVKVECTTEKPAINKGKAKATINGNEVDVNWVQLWENGPKFAEYNVGANSATDVGTKMTFANVTKTGDEYVWGANWCTPSKNDMNELLLAAQGNSSSKVTCNYCEFTQGDGKWGFKFTGKEPGYTDNSVFFPTQGGDSFIGCADYWSATADGGRAWDMFLFYDGGGWRSDWLRYYQDGYCYVRPMLEESSSERYVIVTEKNGTVTVFNFDEVQSVTWEMPAPEPEPTTGTAKAKIGNDEVDVPWVQLWEDGPKFAKYNVGVTDGKAESYGGYYCWGGSIDKDPENAYNTGGVALSGDDDTATKLWGNAWRMPTKAEFEALLANCDVEWTTVNGVNGRKFTGKGDYASNSVFLPAAGRRYGGSVVEQGTEGGYWSSTPEGSPYAYDLDFDSGSQRVDYYYRGIGYSVRAVLAE